MIDWMDDEETVSTTIMGRKKGSHAPNAQKSDAISPCVVGAL
jgi:hypothetical protein